jgi:hypothetical protein
MLHDIEAVLTEAAVLTIVDGKRAVTDNCMQRFTKATGGEKL